MELPELAAGRCGAPPPAAAAPPDPEGPEAPDAPGSPSASLKRREKVTRVLYKTYVFTLKCF